MELTAQKILLNQLKLQGIESLNRLGKRKREASKSKPRKKKKPNKAASKSGRPLFSKACKPWLRKKAEKEGEKRK